MENMTLIEEAKLVKEKVITAQALVYRALIAIEDNAPLNAMTYVDREGAIARAQKIDLDIALGHPVGPLAGVPVVIKDNINTKGLPTTAASRILLDNVPDESATAVELLEQAGAIVIGKANMDELAMGSTGETSAYGETRNPYDLSRVPGGSSSGSAVAVATDQAYLALGSDTGGSVRQPAALCGIVGLRPTYGAISCHGVIPHALTLDQIGIFTKNVADLALGFSVMAKPDPRDPACKGIADYSGEIVLGENGLRGVRIAYVRQEFVAGVDPEVRRAVQRVLTLCKVLGAEVEEIDLPILDYAVATYCVLSSAEAASNYARLDGVHFGTCADGETEREAMVNSRTQGFGDEVKRRIMLGNYVTTDDRYESIYIQAAKVRSKIAAAFDEVFTRYDFILGPTTPTPAFPLGDKTADPVQKHLADLFTVPASLAGLPAMSFPVGASKEGLPVGAQIVGKAFSEPEMFRVAKCLEDALRGA